MFQTTNLFFNQFKTKFNSSWLIVLRNATQTLDIINYIASYNMHISLVSCNNCQTAFLYSLSNGANLWRKGTIQIEINSKQNFDLLLT